MDVPPVHVERHHSELGRWEIALRRPDPRLRACVSRYCGYSESTTGFTRRVEVPSGSVTLIVGFGPAIGITYPRRSNGSTARSQSFVAGLHDSYAVIESIGCQQGIEVNLTPLGAHMLLGVPMDTLTNCVVELEDLPGATCVRLAEQLYDAPSWEARFALLDSRFARGLGEARAPTPSIAWAWRRLNETGGRLAIGALADELGSSRRHLITRFHEEIGLAPKALARVLRFNRAVGLLGRETPAPWAEVAQDCGYYDQAHLNRDFRQFAGATPTDYLARRLPDGGGVVHG